MNIRFSGMTVFPTDRRLSLEEGERVTQALLEGQVGQKASFWTVTAGPDRDNLKTYAVIQTENRAMDQAVFSKAVQNGVDPASIETLDANFFPLEQSPINQDLFGRWMEISGVLWNMPVNTDALLRRMGIKS